MFTLEHLSTMSDIFVGVQNFLDNGSSRDLDMLGKILAEYSNRPHEGYPERFPAIVMEIAATYVKAAGNVDQSKAVQYTAAFDDEGRLNLAMLATNLSVDCTDEQVDDLFLALMDAKRKILAEQEEPAEEAAVAAPQVVDPPAKKKNSSKRRKAA